MLSQNKNYFICFRTPEELYTEYDPTGVVFKPAVPIPKITNTKRSATTHHFTNSKFEDYVNTINIELSANGFKDYYEAYNSNCIS